MNCQLVQASDGVYQVQPIDQRYEIELLGLKLCAVIEELFD
jgi:hypothetical protein